MKLVEKSKRARNKKGTFKKDIKWTWWNDAWEYKLTKSGKIVVAVVLCAIIIGLALVVSAR
tara:strand:+ start:754 stop:936 length:183 start_codon:yes stop_codon:yes gene_type:complete